MVFLVIVDPRGPHDEEPLVQVDQVVGQGPVVPAPHINDNKLPA